MIISTCTGYEQEDEYEERDTLETVTETAEEATNLVNSVLNVTYVQEIV